MAPQALKKGKPLLVVLAGPTGVGKSAVALKLAKRLDGEIVNGDAMQVYRGMDIGTAKPSRADRRKVRHHLIDVVEPSQKMHAARFARLARKAIRGIAGRGHVPILAGGSGLYLRAVLEGIFPGPGADLTIRRKLTGELEEKGTASLHARLSAIDPPAARKIHPNDGRRIIRALEVFLKTGTPISSLQKKRRGIGSDYRLLWFGLKLNRQLLYRRIEARVDRMFRKGLVGEVKRLSKKGMGLTSRKALGYAEILSYLKGEIPLERAKELVKRNHRRYAKRQLTWFRSEKQIRWIPVSPGKGAREVVRQMVTEAKRHV